MSISPWTVKDMSFGDEENTIVVTIKTFDGKLSKYVSDTIEQAPVLMYQRDISLEALSDILAHLRQFYGDDSKSMMISCIAEDAISKVKGQS